MSGLRIWDDSGLENSTTDVTLNVPVGPEWDRDDSNFRPAGLFRVSEASVFQGPKLIQDINVVPGGALPQGVTTLPDYRPDVDSEQHSMTMYRASRKSLVFSAGTGTWSWGLVSGVEAYLNTDEKTDAKTDTLDEAIQQATINMLADMGAAPTPSEVPLHLRKPGLYGGSTDTTAPESELQTQSVSQATGRARDLGGGRLAGVEVSIDGGQTWHRASVPPDPGEGGWLNWTYTLSPPAGSTPTYLTRAVDDSSNMEKLKTAFGNNTLYIYGGATQPTGPWDNELVIIKSGASFTVTNNGQSVSVPTGITALNVVVQLAIGKNKITVIDPAKALMDAATISGGSVPATLSGDLTILGGIGRDTFIADRIKVAGKLTFTGRTGSDTVNLTHCVVNGKTLIDGLRNGNTYDGTAVIGATVNVNDSLFLFPTPTAEEKAISVRTGVGNDKVTVQRNGTLGGNRLVETFTGNDTIDRGTALDKIFSLLGGEGNDTYAYNTNGTVPDPITELAGQGSDTIDFSAASVNVTFNLNNFPNFENVRGGSGNDTLTGTGGDNTLVGNGGTDTLTGGNGNDVYGYAGLPTSWGTDSISDSGGTDRFDYSGAASADEITGVTVVLAGGSPIEDVSGSRFNDTIDGNDGANMLYGNGGKDIVRGFGGNDYFITGGGTTVPSQASTFDGGTGANLLYAVVGRTYVNGTATGGALTTLVYAGAELSTDKFRQAILAVQPGGAALVRPNGNPEFVSVLDVLDLGIVSGVYGRLDLANNDLIIRAMNSTDANLYHQRVENWIIAGMNSIDGSFITNWNGVGIISSTARTSNVATGFDLVGLGVIRNSDLVATTGVPYQTFDGQTVLLTFVLIKFTYIGDANLSGAVTFDDYVGMDNAFFGLIPNLGWATGDINYDNVINFDDYSVVDQAFFFQGAPL